MAPKQIALCEDETFHSGTVGLVGIDPMSHFTIVEEYAADRRAATWTATLNTIDLRKFCGRITGVPPVGRQGCRRSQA